LLLPSLGRAKQKAHQVYCLSNQRKITFDLKLLWSSDDANGKFGGAEVGDWMVNELGRREQGWICPAAPLDKRKKIAGAGYQSQGLGSVRSAWLLETIVDLRTGNGVQGPRMGSYNMNGWLLLGNRPDTFVNLDTPLWPEFFSRESEVSHPEATPTIGDGIDSWGMPQASDKPPRNLVTPETGAGTMGLFCVPRHGRRPSSVSRSWPSDQPLPGAINVSFLDGHGETVPLDRLWRLHWHRDYKMPLRRPGLR
jgi:prepilin-type processing-associated H-X9-DG protein